MEMGVWSGLELFEDYVDVVVGVLMREMPKCSTAMCRVERTSLPGEIDAEVALILG
jgi:hypothetical protein